MHWMLLELADGPKTRAELRAEIGDHALRKALQRMRDKGWAFDGVVLTDAGKKAAEELAGWPSDGTRKTPQDHITEQVRVWRGVRWP